MDRPTLETETKITPGMIEAGAEAIADYIGPGSEENLSLSELRSVASRVLVAALRRR